MLGSVRMYLGTLRVQDRELGLLELQLEAVVSYLI